MEFLAEPRFWLAVGVFGGGMFAAFHAGRFNGFESALYATAEALDLDPNDLCDRIIAHHDSKEDTNP